MSMPSLPEPNPNLTKEQALNMILASIAMEETALSHIINAEGEKIQRIISDCHCNAEDIICVNNSAKEMLEVVMQNQLLLKSKMDKVLSNLPKPCNHVVCSCKHFQHYAAVPSIYCCHQNFLWQKDDDEACIKNIIIPFNGCITVDFMAQLCPCEHIPECPTIELNVYSGCNIILCRRFNANEQCCSKVITGTTSFYLPCDFNDCYACVSLYCPCKAEIKRSEITFFAN